jgi:threonine dehydratase
MIPNAEQVEDARQLLKKYLRPTRLVHAESLERRSRAQVYLKMETDLPTGSFKPRGAIYALLKAGLKNPTGVVAASTGNHGAAVAYASRLFNLPATIFLPENPNPVKRQRIIDLGATVVERGSPDQTAAILAAEKFAREYGHYFLDDASSSLVPCGTATIASEILDELQRPDAIFVPMGDTALIRGVAAEAKRRHPGVRIIGVQSELAPAYARSWKMGDVIVTETCDTIADGLATRCPIKSNVDAIRELVDDVRLVSEQELLDSVGLVLLQEHIVAEPSGAAATAAFLQDIEAYADLNVVLLVTGANVTKEIMRRAIASPGGFDSP